MPMPPSSDSQPFLTMAGVQRARAAIQQQQDIKKFRCLIVDDVPTNRKLLLRYLNAHADCDEVDNGIKAVQAVAQAFAKNQPYDLICLDIMMPDMDGQNALQGIRAIEQSRNIATGQGMRILMVSALNDSETVLNAFRSECDGYLTKPINRQKLFTELIKFQLIET